MALPFGLDTGAALWMAAAIFVAAFVRGYSGFGSAAIIMASAGLVTDPRPFIAVVTLADFLLTFQQWRGIRGHVDWRRCLTLLAGCLIGVPAGLALLAGVSVDIARGVVSLIILVMCAGLVAGVRMARAAGDPAHLGAGFLSGAANAAGVGGLPVVVFFAAQPFAAAAFRATLICYFTLMDLWTLPMLWWHGLVSRDTFVAVAVALPLLTLGIWLGGRRFVHADPKDFRRFAILLLAALASLGLVKSVV